MSTVPQRSLDSEIAKLLARYESLSLWELRTRCFEAEGQIRTLMTVLDKARDNIPHTCPGDCLRCTLNAMLAGKV